MVQSTTIQTTQSSDAGNVETLCNCKLIGNAIWPVTVLILFSLFSKPIRDLLSGLAGRIKNGANLKIGNIFELGLNPGEIYRKAEEEYRAEAQSDEKQVLESNVPKESFIESYLSIESIISGKFALYFTDKYRVLSNYRIAGYNYDLILSALTIAEEDKIFEIKYVTRSELTSSYLDSTFESLGKSKFRYQDTVKKSAKAILLIVLPPDNYNLFDNAKFKARIADKRIIKEADIKIHLLRQDKLTTLTKEDLQRYLD